MRKILFLPAVFCSVILTAQHVTEVNILEQEHWWGGAVACGEQMPYLEPLEYDLETQNHNNQVVPLLLSGKGRYLWSEYPFRFTIDAEKIIITSDYEKVIVAVAGNTLREAYQAVCREHFPPSGVLPDTLFFTVPQYNTWIELMYDQNQEDVLSYARQIVEHGFPAGVLMIDDNWQKYYGNFEFKPDKFPAPKEMVAELHRMGFKVMVWICPFVSADSPEYRFLQSKGYLIKDQKGGTALIKWWNGYSACYDFTNPQAASYFVSLLKQMQQDYGIDGFKFDAGDNSFYNKEMRSYKENTLSVDHTQAWARMGLEFPVNEFRAGWKMGGEALVQRLGDKNYSWKAVQSLIPQMMAAGLSGYAYTCPDMIGGGQYRSFLNVDQRNLDQTLIVRSAQVHALMPMMQFSVAPWRVLDQENLEIVRGVARLHEKFSPYIMECAKKAARTGEPIVRHMEYSFPGEGFALCKDQYMLGDQYLVAPMVTAGKSRMVKLPKGRWKDDLGKIHPGGRTIEIVVPLERLPYFEKLK